MAGARDATSSANAAPSAGHESAALPPGLVYVSDTQPGIRRLRHGNAFRYRASDGRWLHDQKELERIRALAIPPAYEAVWICASPNGHIQATGRDARGRKQYRYHARWRETRDADKFERMLAFGRALPRIRGRVARDLKTPPSAGLTRPLVLATLVRLLDTTFVRIGNEEYARRNSSYGLTTLRNQHAGVRGSVLQLRFRGKSGKLHEVSLDDPRVARVVRHCQQMPGQELFQYVDTDGQACSVGSSDVNEYLGEAADEHFTAKDFRTWHGTVQALELMRLACSGASAADTRLQQVLAEVAGRLGNTVAVCRKAYIHPAVLELGASLGPRAAELAPLWARIERSERRRGGLRAAEWRLLKFLGDERRRKAKRPASKSDAKTTQAARAVGRSIARRVASASANES
jgi:DNA topoisomerase-1